MLRLRENCGGPRLNAAGFQSLKVDDEVIPVEYVELVFEKLGLLAAGRPGLGLALKQIGVFRLFSHCRGIALSQQAQVIVNVTTHNVSKLCLYFRAIGELTLGSESISTSRALPWPSLVASTHMPAV